jgi:glycosyltransferase involved in cell wall biosynthesis
VLVIADPAVDPELTGIEVYPLLPPLFGPRGQTLRTLVRARGLRQVLERCDIAHCLVEPYAPVVALSRPRSIPFVLTAHGAWAVVPLADPWQRLFFRPAFRRVDTIVFQTAFTRDRMAERMRLPHHMVATGGVRPELFTGARPLDGPSWAAKARVVLSVGAVKERKGHDVTLEAVALAREAAPDLHFVLIGATDVTGSYAQDLRRKADGLGMTDNFHMLGRIPFDELVSWYQRADVFVLLPRDLENSFEGLGLVYLEAAAAGLPAVGLRKSGASEAIIDGETGVLIEQGNSNAAAEAILRLLGDEPLRARMGEAGRRRAHQLSWSNLAHRLEDTYLVLLSNDRQAGSGA